jgi:UDP-N-acetylglucosamine diphosphorylase / glucose-1-phosphate thymidylyltransferase / UDP-N-acetylgalactosamine diphosphorylase / glucosamine-1-phosphate N-acetyltransferase / galactosamine-1-phosphate N-acetyltransferase
MKNSFLLNKIIEAKDFPFSQVFDQYPWEAIKNLDVFIEQCFKKGIIKPNYKDKKNVFIGKGTIICEGAHIKGPAIIGSNCVINHASFLRENCLLGNNVHIGHAVEVKNSILLNNSSVAHLSYVGDSIVGNEVNIAGGTIITNLRLDKKPVKIKFKNKIINTKMQKFGSIIGDYSSIGANCVLNPGTILGKKTIVFPFSSVTGTHKNNETIKGIK